MEFTLIKRKINNTLTEEEKIEFDLWYSESKKHRDYFNKVKNSKGSQQYIFNKNKNWNVIKKRIKTEEKTFINYFSVAASIALLFSITYYFTLVNKSSETQNIVVNAVKNDKTILTLADGKEIILNGDTSFENSFVKTEGKKIEYKPASENTKKQSGQENVEIEYNYLTTKRGGEFFLVLVDGTKIWVNSESRLKYPTSFVNGKIREVELVYGEAYFEVSPSINHSGDGFKVTNFSQQVYVLGTHFNVKAYPEDKEIFTTLKEGKVLVKNNKGKEIVLKPNQQLVLNKSTTELVLKEVDVESQISWVRGYFNFNNSPLSEIAKVLTRWYDVDITIQNEEIKKIRFNGVLNKKLDVEFVLNAITNTSDITYDIKNKKILFKK